MTTLHPTLPSHHIVVVDTDDAIRLLLADLLRDEGYQVTTLVSSDAVTLSALRWLQPDLVISDLIVPGTVGSFQLLELIVGDAILQRIPLIVCSASDELRQAVNALNTPQVTPLAKPFELDVLLDLVAVALARKTGAGSQAPLKGRAGKLETAS